MSFLSIYNVSRILSSMLILLLYFLGTWSCIFYGPVLPDWEQVNLWMCPAIFHWAPLTFGFGFVTLNIQVLYTLGAAV